MNGGSSGISYGLVWTNHDEGATAGAAAAFSGGSAAAVVGLLTAANYKSR
jgi:hypothetical protein